MNHEDRAIWSMTWQAMQNTGVRLSKDDDGRFVISIKDRIKGLIQRTEETAMGMYQRALDMRDNRDLYIRASNPCS